MELLSLFYPHSIVLFQGYKSSALSSFWIVNDHDHFELFTLQAWIHSSIHNRHTFNQFEHFAPSQFHMQTTTGAPSLSANSSSSWVTAVTVLAADSSGKATVTIQCQTFRNSTVNCIQSTKAYTVRCRMNSTRYFSSEAAGEQINTGHYENIDAINTSLHGCMMWKLAAISISALMVLFCGTSRLFRMKIQCVTHEI